MTIQQTTQIKIIYEPHEGKEVAEQVNRLKREEKYTIRDSGELKGTGKKYYLLTKIITN